MFKHTKYMMKSDHRVLHWFPKQMKERREALEKVAFEIRDADRVNKTRTRIKVGREDLELSTKLPGGRWKKQVLPFDLPPIDLLYSSAQVQSLSPPPGRPGMQYINLKKRQKSPDVEEDASKKAREDSPTLTGVDKEDVNMEGHSMSSIMDKGKFTGLEAYSPRTPAKAKYIPEQSTECSPVFHSKLSKK